MKLPLSLLLFSFPLFLSCQQGKETTGTGNQVIRIAGSETLHPLLDRWSEEYMIKNPGISIRVTGGGSRYGLKALIDGKTDIAATSRPLKPDEVKRLADSHQGVGVSFLVAKDAITIYVNEQNPVRNLSLEAIRHIFTGTITNWKEVGGADTAIQVFIRPPNSGTYQYFLEHVLLNKNYSPGAAAIPTAELVAEVVSKSRHGIGYGTISHRFPSRNIPVNGIEPTEQTVRSESYPLTRYLYLVVPNTPDPSVMNFIGWVQGEQGQAIVRELGYVPLW
ncbi:MAG: phosphate ABC transporter substrate-binding protein [Bacteroidetes bacterium]|nr:phosphate ABC transporter substrate-binding protein [Bacteroidota bacterium]